MLKRQGSHGAGEWSIPGGTIERHDLNVIAAAAREAMEEVGIAIVNPKVLPYFTDNHWDDDGKAFITIYVVADFGEDCGGENPRVCEPSKASQLRWVDPAKMPHPLFLPLNNIAALGVDFSALYDGPFIDTLAQDMKRLALLEGAYREPVDLETTRKKAKSETVTTEWLVARVLSLADQVENLRGWLERDRTGLASSLSLIKQTANAYRWRANDTAPFATLTALVDEVTAIAERGLRASGDRVTEGFYQRPSAPYAVPSCESALVSALASPDAIDAICESAWNRSVEGNVGLKWKGVSSEYRAASRAGVVAVLQCVLSLSEDRGQTDDSTQEGTAS
jgi:8-oxo-dGTP diphosphatase